MDRISTIDDRRGVDTRSLVRVMLIDDSVVQRSILANILEEQGDVIVVGSASSAPIAIAALRDIAVDVVLLDLEMPGANGLDALPDIVEAASGAHVLILSAFCPPGSDVERRAIQLGATVTQQKPPRLSRQGDFSTVLMGHIRALAARPRAIRPRGRRDNVTNGSRDRDAYSALDKVGAPLTCIAIASSTGGIPVLHDILRALPARVKAPILITQHLPEHFVDLLAGQLQSSTTRPVAVAADGGMAEQGSVYLAPANGHLVLETRSRISIGQHPATNGHLPSADPMFESVGRMHGPGGCLIVLSGMGRDGIAGSATAKAANATVIAQNAASCVVWGMPGAAVHSGLADAILSPPEIVRFLHEWSERDYA